MRISGRAATAEAAERAGAPVIYMEEAGPAAAAERCGAGERNGGIRGAFARMPGARFEVRRVGHNTIRGAAGAAVLNAELMVAEGIVRS